MYEDKITLDTIIPTSRKIIFEVSYGRTFTLLREDNRWFVKNPACFVTCYLFGIHNVDEKLVARYSCVTDRCAIRFNRSEEFCRTASENTAPNRKACSWTSLPSGQYWITDNLVVVLLNIAGKLVYRATLSSIFLLYHCWA